MEDRDISFLPAADRRYAPFLLGPFCHETSVCCAERVPTATTQQQQSPIGQQAQRRSDEAQKQSKVASGTSHNTDEVQRWALALSDEVTAAVDTQDLNRRIFHFLTLCKQHIERTQVSFCILLNGCICACVGHVPAAAQVTSVQLQGAFLSHPHQIEVRCCRRKPPARNCKTYRIRIRC